MSEKYISDSFNVPQIVSDGRAAVKVLSVIASTTGPKQTEAVRALADIATDACFAIEALFAQEAHRHVVEDVAAEKDFFPATFGCSTFFPRVPAPGEHLRTNLKLRPPLYSGTKERKKDIPEEEILAARRLRLMVCAFVQCVLRRGDPVFGIEEDVARTLASAVSQGLLTCLIKSIVDWVFSRMPEEVEERNGMYHALTERKRVTLLSSEPKADLRRAFEQLLRDNLRAADVAMLEAELSKLNFEPRR